MPNKPKPGCGEHFQIRIVTSTLVEGTLAKDMKAVNSVQHIEQIFIAGNKKLQSDVLDKTYFRTTQFKIIPNWKVIGG